MVWRAADGRQLAAGCRPWGEDWDFVDVEGPTRHNPGDPEIDKPERPCSRCGKRFQPTVRRRVLCDGCFKAADSD